jgi:hypothetical protein
MDNYDSFSSKKYKKRQEDMKNLSIYEIALQRILSPQQTNRNFFLAFCSKYRRNLQET